MEKELDYGSSSAKFIESFGLVKSVVANDCLLSYNSKLTNKGRNRTVAFKKSPTILRYMKLPLFRACTIRLSDILITELLWTIQTAAKHSEGS